jgi:hypothetical protein
MGRHATGSLWRTERHFMLRSIVSKTFILPTDRSKISVAAILSQEHDGIERPIAFSSRQLIQADRNYSGSELEMEAIIWSTKHFRSYLYGCKFVEKTIRSTMTYIRNFARNKARLTGWAIRLAQLDFDIVHEPVTQIRHSDTLSRYIMATATVNHLPKGSGSEGEAYRQFLLNPRFWQDRRELGKFQGFGRCNLSETEGWEVIIARPRVPN